MTKPLVFGPTPTNNQTKEPQALSFGAVSPPSIQKTHHQPPAPVFAKVEHPYQAAAIKVLCERFGRSLYDNNRTRLDLLVARLLPLTHAVVSDWGNKSLSRLGNHVQETSKITSSIATLGVNDLIEKTLKSLTPVSGLFGRLKTQDPHAYEPSLLAARSSLHRWLTDIEAEIPQAKQHQTAILLKSASLSSVHEACGDPTDSMLSQAIHNRRSLLQQGVMQSELLVLQLDDVRKQLSTQLSQIDQLVTVTLPAYKAAKASK